MNLRSWNRAQDRSHTRIDQASSLSLSSYLTFHRLGTFALHVERLERNYPTSRSDSSSSHSSSPFSSSQLLQPALLGFDLALINTLSASLASVIVPLLIYLQIILGCMTYLQSYEFRRCLAASPSYNWLHEIWRRRPNTQLVSAFNVSWASDIAASVIYDYLHGSKKRVDGVPG